MERADAEAGIRDRAALARQLGYRGIKLSKDETAALLPAAEVATLVAKIGYDGLSLTHDEVDALWTR